jgi:outer membrane protein OmpA-like peptidoglycan-associated protein
METIMYRKTLASLAIVSLLTAGPASAGPPKEETIGIGTGGVVGALAGGPIGFFIGAAVGAKLGETLHDKNQAIDSLTTEVEQGRSTIGELQVDVRALNRDIDAMSSELDHLRSVSHPELVPLLEAGIAIDLLFQTDRHVLAPSTSARFRLLGQRLADMETLLIHLDGFADTRGDTAHNLALSEKRVQFIREQLIDAGVAPERITTAAHGESPSDEETPDSYALERRVSLNLSLDSGTTVAASPE